MWNAIKLFAKLNIILKNHIFTWFRTGTLSPWKILKDLTGWADAALTAKGYKKLSELRRESKKIHGTIDPVDKPTVPPRNKPKPQERNKFGKLI